MDKEILAERVRLKLEGNPVTSKRMFGGITFLLNNNMLCCSSAKGLMVRVGAEAEADALGRPHATRCFGAGRPMAGFIMVAPPGIEDDKALREWLDRALVYVRKLPPKK
ncbi:MAG: TfoX/Sxy family protein [Sphingomonadales bacterium]|nr:TfoX/Sxy family protein [Sphingomonadales bacterium]